MKLSRQAHDPACVIINITVQQVKRQQIFGVSPYSVILRHPHTAMQLDGIFTNVRRRFADFGFGQRGRTQEFIAAWWI